MKKTVTVAMVAGVAALAIASTASAVTTNRLCVTGATAFRSAAVKAATNMITGASLKFGWTGTKGFTSAGDVQVQGLLASDPSIFADIRMTFNGSVDGIQRLVFNGNTSYKVNFMNNEASLSSTGTPNITKTSEALYADAAFSDAFQNSTLFQDPQLPPGALDVCGVIPFVWVKNAGAPAGISNMTPIIAQKLISAGEVPLSFFTGSTNDAAQKVRLVGRNADSGSRVGAFAEAGAGVTAAASQWKLIANTNNAIIGCQPWPAETVLGTYYPAGQSGHSSGGDINTLFKGTNSNSATVTNQLGASSPAWYVAYVGIGDATGLTQLTYNGVPYSQNALRNGQYSFWTYEHLMNIDGLPTGTQTLLDSLFSTLLTFDPGTSAVKLDTMNVGRGQEGGPIGYGNPY